MPEIYEPKSLHELSSEANVNVQDVQMNQDIHGTTPETAVGNVMSLAEKGTVPFLSTDKASERIDTMKDTLDGYEKDPSLKTTRTEPSEPAVPDEEPKDNTYTFDEAVEVFGEDFTGLHRNADGTYTADTSALERVGITGLEDTSEADQLEADYQDASDNVNALAEEINSYDLDQDPDFQNQLTGINAEFAKLKSNMERINKSRMRALQTLGMRSGASRYAGSVQMGIEGEEANQASQRIAELERQKNAAISAARSAYKREQWTEFAVKMDALQTIRNNEAQELSTYNEAIIKANEKFEAIQKAEQDQIKADRLRAGILDIMDQGFTDPLDILSALELSGIRATPEDVTKYTNLIENKDVLAGLSGDAKVFEWYKLNQPEMLESMGITSPLEWMKATSAAKRAPKTGGGGGATTFKLSTTQKSDLVGIGLNNSEIIALQNDINQYGLNASIEGLDENLKSKIKNIFGSDTGYMDVTPEEAWQIVRQAEEHKTVGGGEYEFVLDESKLPGTPSENIYIKKQAEKYNEQNKPEKKKVNRSGEYVPGAGTLWDTIKSIF